MTIFDLFFLASVLVLVSGLLTTAAALLMRRPALAGRVGLGLAAYVGLYAVVLASVALLRPQKVLALHENRCFDDWCVAVESVEQRPTIGATQAQGTFYLVTLQVSSQARRISQRALDAAVHLLDEGGQRYDPSLPGQQALEALGQAGKPLNSEVEAGGAFRHTAVFDVSAESQNLALVVAHGVFPGRLIIANDDSWLHKPTIVPLPAP